MARAWARSKKRGGVKVGNAGSFVLAQGGPKKKAKLIMLLGFAQLKVWPRELRQHRAILRGNRFPAAGSKIIIFLMKNRAFCAAGENGTS